MGRNKYPEQTFERILEASAKLFIEKGYEQTSIQDILDVLKLSKGGLYHHFRSKEEILEAVLQKRAQFVAGTFHEVIRNTKADNAKERLQKILLRLTTDIEVHTLDSVMNSQKNNSYFVINALQACVMQDAPVLCGLIEEGIRDGSLQTEQPALCAEVFLLLLNYWTNPALFNRSYSETRDRLLYLQSVMRQLGLDIIEENLITASLNAYEKTGAFTNP